MLEKIIEYIQYSFLWILAFELTTASKGKIHEKRSCVFIGVLRQSIFFFTKSLNYPMDQILANHNFLRLSTERQFLESTESMPTSETIRFLSNISINDLKE